MIINKKLGFFYRFWEVCLREVEEFFFSFFFKYDFIDEKFLFSFSQTKKVLFNLLNIKVATVVSHI
jgi:hypothetical protein